MMIDKPIQLMRHFGGVFDNDMIDAFITLKMEEVTRLRMVPHPIEFDMYYSC